MKQLHDVPPIEALSYIRRRISLQHEPQGVPYSLPEGRSHAPSLVIMSVPEEHIFFFSTYTFIFFFFTASYISFHFLSSHICFLFHTVPILFKSHFRNKDISLKHGACVLVCVKVHEVLVKESMFVW